MYILIQALLITGKDGETEVSSSRALEHPHCETNAGV